MTREEFAKAYNTKRNKKTTANADLRTAFDNAYRNKALANRRALLSKNQTENESQYKVKLPDVYKNDVDNVTKGAAGYKLYEDSIKKAVQAEEEKPWYIKVADVLAAGNTTDTSLPAAMMNQAIAATRADESYRSPSQEWTDEERNAFGYLYAIDPKQAHDYAEETNNARNEHKKQLELDKAKREATKDGGSMFGNALAAIGAGLTGGADYLTDLVQLNARGKLTTEEGISPFEWSQAVKEGIGTKLNRDHGTIPEDVWVFGGKGWGDVYQLGSSIVESGIAAYTGGSIGTLAIFFGNAAAAGIDDAKARGATDDQAFLYGTLMGVAEGTAEKIGVDNLFRIGKSGKTGFINAAKEILKQAGAEGTEEGVTAVLGLVFDNMVMGDKSNYNALVSEYMAQGMSRGDAEAKASWQAFGDIVYDVVGGAVSGAARGTPQSVGTAIKQRRSDVATGRSIIELAGAKSELYDAANLSTSEDTKKLLERAVKAKKGSGKEARLTAQLARSVGSEYRDQTADYMTPEEIVAIEGDEAVARYEAEKTDFERKTEKYIEKQSKAYEKVAESNATVANIGLKSKPIAPSKKYNPETRDVYNYGRLEYNGDPREYDLYFEMARNLGLNADGRSFTDMFNTLSETDRKGMLTLDSDVIRAAFDDGVTTVQKIKQEQAAKDEIKKRAKEIEDAKAKKADEEHSNVEGNKTDENADVEENETEEVDKSNFLIDKSVNQDELNRTQRTAIERIRKLAEYLDGVSFRITNTLGEIDGNGYYDKENKTVVININAGKIGDPQGVFDFAVDAAWTHEIGHYIKEKSPQKFEEIKAFIKKEFYQYDAWDGAVEMRLDQYRAQLGKSADEFTFEMAEEEVVCNSLGKMLTSKRVMKRLAGEHRSAFGTIWRFVRDFFEKLIGKISGYGRLDKFSYRTAEEEIVLDGAKRKRDKLEKMFADALVDANTTAKAEQTVEYATKSKTAQNSENSGLTNTNEQNVHVSGENNYNPSSIKNTEVKKDVKFSLVDREYLAAVERGDMEAAQAMVDEAAKAAGYTDKLYHGTHQFGFTEFDPSYSDDKISLFVAGSPDISQTYSGRYGTRKISDAYKVDGLTIAEVVERLNKEAHESYDGEQLKIEYEIMYLQDVNRVINEVNDGVDWLSELVGKKIKEYAERMATDFDDKDAKTHKKLVELKEILDNYQYEYMSTPIYMLLHYTDAFDDGARVADLEYKIRLMNKLQNADTSNGVVVKKDLDGYGVSILYFDEVRLELKQRNAEGNYALYGNPRNQLVIDGGGRNWNDLRNWIKALYYKVENTEVESKGDYYRLYDKKTGNEIFHGRIQINEANSKLPIDYLHPIMVQKANNVLSIRGEYHHTTRDIARFAKDLGYESVKFENIEDNGGNGRDSGPGDVYAYFNPNNLKSADPITYDESGNVIPLSERFNPAKKDIRYSLQDDYQKTSQHFKKTLDAWDRKTEGFSFVMGYTPEYLSNLKINNAKIGNKQVRIDATKIKRILRDHPEMTLDIIKELPELLHSPILVLDSKTVAGRLVLLGEVYANDKPVMMALELNPTSRSGKSNYIDIIKIASAYTRTNTQRLISTSNIRYIGENKNRVNEWLKVNRLQLPLPNSHSNSVNTIIADNSEKSNTSGEFFSKKYSLSDRELREKLAESFYGMAESDEERNKVEEYRSELNKVDEWMGERQQLIAEFEELRGVKGKSKERTEINKRIIVLNDWITRHDEKLLKIAAAKPFRDVIDRYEAKAFEEGAAKSEGEVRMSAGQFKKMIADYTKPKVYSKSDAEKAIKPALQSAGVAAKKRDSLIEELWEGMNSAATDAERIKIVQDMSARVFDAIVTEAQMDNPDYEIYRERLDYLKQYVGRLTFTDDLMAEIKHKFDTDGTKSFLGRWGNKRNDGSAVSADMLVTDFARDNAGYEYLKEMPVSDALFEINDIYEEARSADKTVGMYDEASNEELVAVKSQIIDDILDAFNTGGQKSKADAALIRSIERENNYARAFEKANIDYILSKSHERELEGELQKATRAKERAEERAENAKQYFKQALDNVLTIEKMRINLDRIARKLRDKKYGTFERVSEVSDASLSELLKDLAAFNYRGTITVSNLQEKTRRLFDWYNKNNPMLEYRSDESPGYYNLGIHNLLEHLSTFKGAPTVDDYTLLYEVLSYFDKFVDEYHKVWKRNRWVDAKDEAMGFVEILEFNKAHKVKSVDMLLRNNYYQFFGDPMAVARAMDYYNDNGFYSTFMQYLRECEIKAQIAENEMLKPYYDFLNKHPEYLDKINEDAKYKSYDAEAKKEIVHKIPKTALISLYMTMKRDHSNAGIVFGGFRYEKSDGEVGDVNPIRSLKQAQNDSLDENEIQVLAKSIVAEQARQIEKNFSKTDLEYISVLEDVYNNKAREVKRQRDMARFGYSNVTDGYYYPIKRADAAKSIDSTDIVGELDRISHASFNKSEVKGSKHGLEIRPTHGMFLTHVRGVCLYGYVQEAIEYYDKVYHMTVNDNALKPKSIATISVNVWREGDKYFRNLIGDIQGVRHNDDPKVMKFLSAARSAYAKAMLGANPKVWLSQLSSLVAAGNILGYGDILTGALKINGKDVDNYCRLAKLRNEDNAAAMAQGLFDKKTVVGKTENALGKLGDVLMKPIGFVDRKVIEALFGACQLHVERDGKGRVGTEKNKVAAGELLEKVIIETQQNSLPTEKAAAMRSNELARSFVMFFADSMKLIGRMFDGIGRVLVFRKLVLNSTGSAKSKYQKLYNEAKKTAARGITTMLASAVFMALVTVGIKWIRGRDDEITFWGSVNDTLGNLVGGLPLIRDLYTVIFEGFDKEVYVFAMLNDFGSSIKGFFDSVGEFLVGEGSTEKLARNIKNLIYAAGQFAGVPARNIYNYIYGILKRLGLHGWIDEIFGY